MKIIGHRNYKVRRFLLLYLIKKNQIRIMPYFPVFLSIYKLRKAGQIQRIQRSNQLVANKRELFLSDLQ